MTQAPARAVHGYWLKFGEILLCWFIPIGILQVSNGLSDWEYLMVTKTPILLATLGGFILLSALIAWYWNKRGGGDIIHPILQTIITLYLAYSISTYGAAKILGTQFHPPHYILETPIGELNGFWLTWTYYGFSHTMALIIGWTQIIGSILILFRPTRLIGLLILLPVMLNIDLIDHFYSISPMAYFNALHYTFFIIVLLLFDLPLIRTALLHYMAKTRITTGRALLQLGKITVIILAFVQILSLKAGLTPPTRLNGVWRVDSMAMPLQKPIAAAAAPWSRLYFEWRYGCIFKAEPLQFTPKDLNGDYTVDEKTSTLHIGFEPKSDSMLLHYSFTTDSLLTCEGKYKGDSLRLYLKRLK